MENYISVKNEEEESIKEIETYLRDRDWLPGNFMKDRLSQLMKGFKNPGKICWPFDDTEKNVQKIVSCFEVSESHDYFQWQRCYFTVVKTMNRMRINDFAPLDTQSLTSPLHTAVLCGNVDLVDHLIRNCGLNPNAKAYLFFNATRHMLCPRFSSEYRDISFDFKIYEYTPLYLPDFR